MKIKTDFKLANVVKALLVIAIFTAVLGAVVLIPENRHRRRPRILSIDQTLTTLEMGLMNFRASEERWPVTFGQGETNQVMFQITFREDNALVFAPLLKNPKRQYFDASMLLTKVLGQGVLPLNKALKKGIAPEQCPLGYLDPSNKEIFKYFKVTFDLRFDTVKVER